MTAHIRITALVLAALFAAAPALALAGLDCTSCCCQVTPCDDTGADCEALTDTPCCDEAPPAVPGAAKRTVEAPSLHQAAPACSAPAADVQDASTPLRGGNLAVLISPLRRSVVLRI